MAIKLVIYEDVKTESDEFAELLRYIADLLDQGYICGYYPTWDIEEDNDDPEEEDADVSNQ